MCGLCGGVSDRTVLTQPGVCCVWFIVLVFYLLFLNDHGIDHACNTCTRPTAPVLKQAYTVMTLARPHMFVKRDEIKEMGR